MRRDPPGPTTARAGAQTGSEFSRLPTGGLRSVSRPDICLKWWLPRRKRGSHEEESIQHGLGSWIDEVRIHPGIQVRSQVEDAIPESSVGRPLSPTPPLGEGPASGQKLQFWIRCAVVPVWFEAFQVRVSQVIVTHPP